MLILVPLVLALVPNSGDADPRGFDPRRLPAPLTDADFRSDGAPPAAQVELGRLLFFDKVLSGNRNVSCATCHHPEHATSDGLALGLGEGATGLGPARRAGRAAAAPHERVPRNSPALFNLGAHEVRRLFHDGRVETDEHGFYEGGFVTPARWKLPAGLADVLAAQAMFPVTSPTEMAGQQGENELADARAANRVAGPDGLWDRLGARLRAIPEYVTLFRAAFPDRVQRAEDVSYVLAANAIAAFEAAAFRSDDSPFDRWLRGGRELEPPARRGMELYYGAARCYRCHDGPLLTDHEFHAIAMPQAGPGKADGTDASYWRATGLHAFVEDFGRGRETARAEDRYRFRTPSLRNVALTGPWGHAGTYDSLEAVVRHHLDPVAALERWRAPADLMPPLAEVLELVARGDRLEHARLDEDRRERFLARDGWVQSRPELRAAIAAASELEPVSLTDADVADLVAFLEALTDPSARELGDLVPERVPSGLPVAD